MSSTIITSKVIKTTLDEDKDANGNYKNIYFAWFS